MFEWFFDFKTVNDHLGFYLLRGTDRLWDRYFEPFPYSSSNALTIYFLRFKKVGTLDWARPFPADASSTSRRHPQETPERPSHRRLW